MTEPLDLEPIKTRLDRTDWWNHLTYDDVCALIAEIERLRLHEWHECPTCLSKLPPEGLSTWHP